MLDGTQGFWLNSPAAKFCLRRGEMLDALNRNPIIQYLKLPAVRFRRAQSNRSRESPNVRNFVNFDICSQLHFQESSIVSKKLSCFYDRHQGSIFDRSARLYEKKGYEKRPLRRKRLKAKTLFVKQECMRRYIEGTREVLA